MIAVVHVFLFRSRICHWVTCPCVCLHHILIYKTQILFRRLESCQVFIFTMSRLCLTLYVLQRVRKSWAPVRPGHKPVCRAPSIWGSAVWNQLHITPFGAHNFEVPARFFENVSPMPYVIFVRHDCTVLCFCTPGVIKWLIFALSDNAQNCVDIIAHGLQLSN